MAISLKEGDCVVVTQMELSFVGDPNCGHSLFGLRGIVMKTTARDSDELCLVTFQRAGKFIVEKCNLELVDAET